MSCNQMEPGRWYRAHQCDSDYARRIRRESYEETRRYFWKGRSRYEKQAILVNIGVAVGLCAIVAGLLIHFAP